MPKRHDQLFARIASFQALYAAARRAVKGKRKKPGAAAFFANLEGELLAPERQLRGGYYRSGRYVAFEVNDPKKRIVSPLRFATASSIMRSARSSSRYSNGASSITRSPTAPARERTARSTLTSATAVATPVFCAATSIAIFRRSTT